MVTVVGNGSTYLEARAKVLAHFWRVETVALDEGQRLPLETDLLVVSASIPEVERQVIVDRARTHNAALLIVRTAEFDAGPHASADATVDEGRGPGALISTIYELLTERGLPSRGWPLLYQGEWVQ